MEQNKEYYNMKFCEKCKEVSLEDKSSNLLDSFNYLQTNLCGECKKNFNIFLSNLKC